MKRITRIVLVVEIVLAAVGLGVSRWTGTPILEITRVDLTSIVLALAATLPLLALLFVGMREEVRSLAWLREMFHKFIIPTLGNLSTFEILLVSIMAGFGEEVFFRGFLQGALGRVFNPWMALVLVSILFGLAHYVSLRYAIVTALIGAYLGALFLWTGNLFVPMAVHALYDFVAILMILRMARQPVARQPVPRQPVPREPASADPSMTSVSGPRTLP